MAHARFFSFSFYYWLGQACDLLGVAAHERFERKGLCTLATVLVDYRGYRVVCQSVIPGEWAGSTMAWFVCLQNNIQFFIIALFFCETSVCVWGGGRLMY